ncbi:MAG: hypothetical protein KJ983_04855, partial [Candidatus Omnitrophica bacterium]|nr:hypothetical protein [Candidatus Omnitrophota bacterium]
INNGFLKKDADWKDQIEVMQRKGHLGMNAILAQSLAMGRLIAHMQGKELKDILRETLKETMAKVIMHHGGIDNLEETAFRKIPDKQAPNMWKILAETLTFDELKKGLQNVNKNNLKGKKLFEILREELPVYGDKAEQPLAKKKGQVSHTSVRRVIKKLFDTKNMQNFTVTARNTVREYLMQSEVVKKIGDLIPVDKLLKQLEETNFYYNVDSENISPCLLCPNRNNYTVAHPSLTNGNVYFTKTMIENLTQEDSELLAVLLTREVMCLHTGLEIYDGKNYAPAEKYGEKYAEKLEKALVGERLDNYLQLKVDNYLLQKKAYNWRNDQFYAPSAINKDENVFLIAGNMRFIFWGKDLEKITSKEVQEEYVKAINEEKFQVISITDSGSPEWEQFVEKYKDRLFIPDVRLVAGEGLASPVGDMENFSLAKKEVKEKVLTPQGALDSRGGVILKAKDGSNYFFWKEEGKQAVSREELLEIYRKALEEETLPIMTIEDSFISDMEWQNFLKQHKNELKKASDKTPLDKIALIEKETGVSMSSDLTPILLTSEEVTPEMTLSAGEKAVLLAVVEKRLEAKSVKATIPKWFVLPNDKDQASLKKQEIVRRNREQFDKKLAWIAGKSGLKFGDAENPLLVAVRDSSPIDQPGQNPTLLNVGLTDETVEGLAELLGDEYLAYRFYTDFIRDLAVVSGKATKDDFTDVNLMSIIPWDSAVSKRKWRVQTSKEMYSKKVGKTFPQDPFEQLDLAVSLVALCNTRHDGPTRPFEVNAVMVQEMSLNVLVGDFAGIARSRDPLTGKKEINGTCKEAVLGSEISELKGLEALTEKYPEMKNELRDLLLEVEKCIEDMALIEFGVV